MDNEQTEVIVRLLRELADKLAEGSLDVRSFQVNRHTSLLPGSHGIMEEILTGDFDLEVCVVRPLPRK